MRPNLGLGTYVPNSGGNRTAHRACGGLLEPFPALEKMYFRPCEPQLNPKSVADIH
jgi:hypothetical protein